MWIKKVIVRAEPGNRNDVFIGNSEVTSSGVGLRMGHGYATTSNTVELYVDNITDVYISCKDTGGVSWIAERR